MQDDEVNFIIIFVNFIVIAATSQTSHIFKNKPFAPKHS